MLSKVKTSLRISNAVFDDEISDLIEAAKMDLNISGVGIINETDEIGQEVELDTFIQVYANKKPIAINEFFEARQQGIKTALMFEVREIDYNNEEKLRYNNKIYSIYRAYPTKNEMIELYCEVRVGG